MSASANTALNQSRVDGILQTIAFLYGEATDDDDTTVRAMIVKGGTDRQITESITISAVNTRIPREDKSRYAFGVLRNLMMEVPEDDA